MPVTTSAAMPTAATMPNTPSLRLERRGGVASGMLRVLRGRRRRFRLALVHEAENHGNKYKRRDRREEKAADDGATERRVLLAALAETQRHGRHADDHRQGGHDDGAEAHET